MTTRVRTGLRIPMDLNTELIVIAQKNGVSKNALILQILWSYVEQQEKEKQLDERRSNHETTATKF